MTTQRREYDEKTDRLLTLAASELRRELIEADERSWQFWKKVRDNVSRDGLLRFPKVTDRTAI